MFRMTKKTGLVFFPAFDWSISPTHPEREERLLYTRDQIAEEGILDLPEIIEYKAELATPEDILRTHFCLPSLKEIITDAHLVAAGSTIALGRAWHQGEINNGFALIRPPGHHAMHITYGNRGFCNINNEAILVEYLRSKYGYRKIAIIDSDVHHGDGTQDIFYNDPDVLFISFHQDGRTLFPGTGFTNELGGPNAFGTTINIPLPPGTGDKGIHYLLDNLILPILHDFQPEIIINSAGQDNHFTDPLANMNFTAQGYGLLTEKLSPDLLVLEGGYAVETALPYINMALILALANQDYSNIKEPGLFDSKRLKSAKDDMAYLKKTADSLLSLWSNRHNANIEKIFGTSDFYNRKKSIFYDTDYFVEEQREEVRICKKCGGLVIYTSQLVEGSHTPTSVCISIPLYACSQCQRLGKERYEKERANGGRVVYLQDKPNDIYKASP